MALRVLQSKIGGRKHVGTHPGVSGEGLGTATVEVDGSYVVCLGDDFDRFVSEVRVGASKLVDEVRTFNRVAREDLLVVFDVFDDARRKVDTTLAANDGTIDDFGAPNEVCAVLE